MQRDVMETRDQVHTIKTDHSSRFKETSIECNTLRIHWEKQVDVLNDRLREYDLGRRNYFTRMKEKRSKYYY